MTTKVRIDPQIVLNLTREDAVRYYVCELDIDEVEATQIASTTHPGFIDVVRPTKIEARSAGLQDARKLRFTRRLHPC